MIYEEEEADIFAELHCVLKMKRNIWNNVVGFITYVSLKYTSCLKVVMDPCQTPFEICLPNEYTYFSSLRGFTEKQRQICFYMYENYIIQL